MMFNTRVDQLNENENVKEMIKQVNGEWFQEDGLSNLMIH